jgi:hypothetical protein
VADYSGFYGGHNHSNINQFLQKYVAEIVFVRRRRAKDPDVTAKTRRMICTLCVPLLNSVFGKKVLGFKPPRQTADYSSKSKGLVVVWDCLMKDWRSIDIKSCVVIKKKGDDSLPMYVNSKEGIEQFAKFYNLKLAKMDWRKFMDT